MNNYPEIVSIVLTTLNCATYLREAIESCLNQTYSNLELIVVDGGSTDGTLEIIHNYNDPRIRLIHQQNNVGKLPGAINLGLDSAQGEYLTWMQGDSIYHLRAIETMVHCLEQNPEIGQVYTDFWEIDAEDVVKKVIQTCESDDIIKSKSDPLGVCFLIRRSVREKIGPHDIATFPTQDYDYRLRIAMHFQSMHIPEPLYYWRYHPNSLSGRISWTDLARNDVKIRLKLGLSNHKKAQKDFASLDIADAFERYQAGICADVPELVWSGLRRDWSFALDRGVWSIFLRSLYPWIKAKIHA